MNTTPEREADIDTLAMELCEAIHDAAMAHMLLMHRDDNTFRAIMTASRLADKLRHLTSDDWQTCEECQTRYGLDRRS